MTSWLLHTAHSEALISSLSAVTYTDLPHSPHTELQTDLPALRKVSMPVLPPSSLPALQ